jgi:hypothetical protein
MVAGGNIVGCCQGGYVVQKNRWFVHGAALLIVLSLVLFSEAWLSAQSTP